MPIYQDVKFNPATFPGGAPAIIEFSKNFWSIMNGGVVPDTLEIDNPTSPPPPPPPPKVSRRSPSVLAHPQFVEDGPDSHLLISFAQPNDMLEVSGAFSTEPEMVAAASQIPNGAFVNCFDPATSKRGRYSKNGSSLSRVDVSPKDKAWTDYNHPQRLLELLFCSFIKYPNPSPYSETNPLNPLPFMGPKQGWIGPQAPGGGDWRGVRLTYDMRAVNLSLGPYAKIGQHVQGNVKLRSDVLPLVSGLKPAMLPNFIQKRQLISDQLGFGINSWGKPNDVGHVADSGRRSVIVDFTANDADWECFGTPKRPLGLVNYGSEPIASVLEKFMGNSYMLAHHPKPYDSIEAWLAKSPAPTNEWHAVDTNSVIRDIDRVRGEIRIYGFKIEGP